MTKDEIIYMALKAGMKDSLMYEHIKCDAETLTAFAEEVAKYEREACAKVVEDWSKWFGGLGNIATAIRARGQA
jgi:hypothetical protein